MLGQQLELEGDGNENVPLCYYITDNIGIQCGREKFCMVTGLRFGVENLADYNNVELPIPFRRRVFPSSLDGEHITSNMVFRIIDDELFDRLHDDDAVSLCCLGILQLVLLGVEGKRRIPDWMLRLANDRNLLNRGKKEQHPSIYKRSPFMEQPPSTILPKQRDNKTKKNVKKSNLSPLNLENALDDENEGGDDVIFLGGQFTGLFSSSYLLATISSTFVYAWIDSKTPMGWLSGEHMNSWMELLIRNRTKIAPWTVAYTNTISVHPKNQRFLIDTYQHAIGILDGSTRSCLCLYMLEEITGSRV
nr:hypothetical protein [Tanacetum cinerariifolium]